MRDFLTHSHLDEKDLKTIKEDLTKYNNMLWNQDLNKYDKLIIKQIINNLSYLEYTFRDMLEEERKKKENEDDGY